MKKLAYQIVLLAFILFSLTSVLSAQNSSSNPIVISGTKFTYPLIQKWINEYAKVNPNVSFKVEDKAEAGQIAVLKVIAHQPATNELNVNNKIIYTGRYALLPITNDKNPVLTDVTKKGLTKKEIDNLFFDVVLFDDETEKKVKPKFNATVYARESKACSSTALANYFGHSASEIKGKKVLGNDLYIISAVKKDSFAIAFNSINNLYDINTRQLKPGISLLPLDIKKEIKDKIYENNLDVILGVLEENKLETIPVEKLGFVISTENQSKEVNDFLKWVLTEGQKYNKGEGFLSLDKETLTSQAELLEEKLLTLK